MERSNETTETQSPPREDWALPAESSGHREENFVKSRRGQSWGTGIFRGDSETDRGNRGRGLGNFTTAIVAASLRMDGMAKRQRTVAGDELSEEFGRVGSARADLAAADKEAVYVPASAAEGMSAAGDSGMQSGEIGRDRNPASEQRDIGIVAGDAGGASLFGEWTAMRRAVALFDSERSVRVAWRIEL